MTTEPTPNTPEHVTKPSAPASSSPTRPGLAPATLGAILLGITLLAYLPTFQNQFIWDDDEYVLNNQMLRSASGLRNIWFSIGATPQYYPLVHTSFWLEYQTWGLHPLGYHVVNTLLHGLAAVLVWRVLLRLRLPGSPWSAWFAGAVFALHPVHVESVAWITERKNVMMAAFYAASLLCYLRFLGFPSPREPDNADATPEPELTLTPDADQWKWYGGALALFACAMLSKTVACTMPVAIVLLLWWKFGRVNPRQLLPLVPYFVIGAPLGLLTAHVEKSHVGAVGADWQFTFIDRCLIAGRALWFYAAKLVVPSNLMFIYPRWEISASAWWQWLFPLGVAAALIGLWLARRAIGRGPLAAALFFCVTLGPALGFVNIYPMRFSFVADHFQYVASLGLIALACGGIAWLGARFTRGDSRFGIVLGVIVLIALGAHTAIQSLIYYDHETLWTDTLNKNDKAWLAHNNLGIIKVKRNEYDEALAHFTKAVALHGGVLENRVSLGLLLSQLGRREDAVEQLEIAHSLIAKDDDRAAAIRNKLGELHDSLGQRDKARVMYEENITYLSARLDARKPYSVLLAEFGVSLAGVGKLDGAILAMTDALKMAPDYPGLYEQLGKALLRAGRANEGVECFKAGIMRDPNAAELYRALAWTLATHPDVKIRNPELALKVAQAGNELTGGKGPRYLDALAAAQAAGGDFDAAVKSAELAIKITTELKLAWLRGDIEKRAAEYREKRPYISGRAATQPATAPATTRPETMPATQSSPDAAGASTAPATPPAAP